MLENKNKLIFAAIVAFAVCATLFYFAVWRPFVDKMQDINESPRSIYQSTPK
jgi:preprotein translocase subunit YajC